MAETPASRETYADSARENDGAVAVLPGPPDRAAAANAPAGTVTGERCAWAGAARWWFEALDERRVDAGASSWVAQVIGIHEVRPHLWIQLESVDTTRRVVLHVTLETRLDEALAAIADSPCDAHRLTFIDVPSRQRTRRVAIRRPIS
jgi:hypothetical protein